MTTDPQIVPENGLHWLQINRNSEPHSPIFTGIYTHISSKNFKQNITPFNNRQKKYTIAKSFTILPGEGCIGCVLWDKYTQTTEFHLIEKTAQAETTTITVFLDGKNVLWMVLKIKKMPEWHFVPVVVTEVPLKLAS